MAKLDGKKVAIRDRKRESGNAETLK